MSQLERGFRAAVLDRAWAYDLLMRAAGRSRAKREIVSRYVRPQTGQRILDVGAGTARILDFLPQTIAYVGVDISDEYIAAARARYGARARFVVLDVGTLDDAELPASSFDLALAQGLLHHLDDDDARALGAAIARLLTPQGRLLAIDPVLVGGQNPVGRLLIANDRGRNVRSPEGYQALMAPSFSSACCTVRHDLLRIPYAHNVLECSGPVRG